TDELNSLRTAVVQQTLAEARAAPPAVVRYRTNRYRTVAEIGVQAARALAAAHKEGVLHRDIKPSNVMIDHYDQLYLLDFGLTRALDSGIGTRVGVVVGTPWYMSPEQAQGQPLDSRSDLFSLGITLYELATGGRGPYTASRADGGAVLVQVRAGAVRPLRELAPDIPPTLEAILVRATDPRLDRRYQTAQELVGDLERFLASSPSSVTKSWPDVPRRARKIAVSLAAVLGIAIVAVVGFAIFSGTGPAPESAQQEPPPAAENQRPLPPARPHNVRVNLFREDGQPAFHRVVLGDGKFSASPTGLMLFSAHKIKPTLLALDTPDGPGFDFAVELNARAQNNELENDLGVFWGWRDKGEDPLALLRFLAAALDTRPVLKDVHGRLYVGSWMFLEPKDGRMGISEQTVRPLHQGQGWIPLAAPPKGFDGWHKVSVRVVGRKCTVTIDREPPREFDVPWMVRADAWLKTYSLSERGSVGVWVRNGWGSFRNATITALPGADD
ncbi:MAG TPA: protein kinase, partial [Gemmataceae bacterium]|nr:protein kinase [Gemmataceae bacterium]